MTNPVRTAVLFDMRAPAFGASPVELYNSALDMAAYADEFGIDRVLVMEHHASEDGYLPSPFVMAGGIASRTRQARIVLGAIILPLHDPVKIAEQMAVLDLMSGGRLDVIIAAGYVPSEFARFKRSLHDRGKNLDSGIDIIIRSLRGERFEAEGREVFVRPLPIQDPVDMLIGGGGVPASARRAARFGIGFSPLRPDLIPLYEEECRKLGKKPGRSFTPGVPISIHISEDPDRGWQLIERHVVHVAAAYAKWAEEEGNSASPFKGLDDREALKRSGMFAVWTPDEVVANAPAMAAANQMLNFMPLLGGLSPDVGWESLRLLKEVMPRLKALAGVDTMARTGSL